MQWSGVTRMLVQWTQSRTLCNVFKVQMLCIQKQYTKNNMLILFILWRFSFFFYHILTALIVMIMPEWERERVEGRQYVPHFLSHGWPRLCSSLSICSLVTKGAARPWITTSMQLRMNYFLQIFNPPQHPYNFKYAYLYNLFSGHYLEKHYTVSQKIRATLIFMITSPNVDQFSQFLPLNWEMICGKRRN